MKMIKIYGTTILLSLLSLTSAYAEPVNYRMVYIGDDTNNSSYLGAKQGLDEANRQGQFLNQNYTLDVIDHGNALNSDLSQYLAVISATDKDTYLKLAEKLPDTAVININLSDDDLRALCLQNGLHVPPSQQMISDAEAQWRQKTPDSKAKAQAWHADFQKYAARELNNRFRKAHNVRMDNAAWASWAAIKMVTDTVARQGITDAGKLLGFLKNDLVFDGQKGTDMSFRKTGQLRQILLLVEDDKIVGEAPVAGVVKSGDIDSLGNTECAK